MKKSLCVIPARMGSSRFPGKPLKKICGKEMVGYCYENAIKSQGFDYVCIATPDEEIISFCKEKNFNVVLTSNTHERCTSRTLEALHMLEEKTKNEFSKIVMLQGDEPLISPKMLQECLNGLSDWDVVNLASEIKSDEEHGDINEVKVVFSKNMKAIYFSRAKIPSTKDNFSTKAFKQVCAIGFSKNKLELFESLKPSTYEIYESIDMNRFIENEIDIGVIKVNGEIASVDTLEDLQKVEGIISRDER